MPAKSQTEHDARAAERVVKSAFDALAAMQWDSVASLMHPVALRRFHLAQIEGYRAQERFASRRATERYNPDMPPEVQAWFEEQRRNRELQFPSGVAADFAGVSSIAELEALSPEQAFARWIEAHDARTVLIRHRTAQGKPIPPELPVEHLHPSHQVLGSVVEDDSTIQVLHRSGPTGEAPGAADPLSVVTMRRSPEGWRIWTLWNDRNPFGQYGFVIGIDTPEDRAERLQALAEQSFAWPEGEAARVRAAVHGYAGDGYAPEAIRIEVAQPDGSTARVDLPHEALVPLWQFLEDWMHLPGREGGAGR